MELFSEIYNCYYQIMKSILQNPSAFTNKELYKHISLLGYEESIFHLIPKLSSGEWDLFHKEGDLFISKLKNDFFIPLSHLQKSYIKTILQDEKIQLFFEKDKLTALQQLFSDVNVLWKPDDFYYYDRFSDKDDYQNPDYQKHFRLLLSAIINKQYVDITYEARQNHRIHHKYLPYRLEYSIKNDKFRLLGMTNLNNFTLQILNLNRIKEITLLPKFAKNPPDINKAIKASYYKEPVHFLIHTERNALERAMLQFANYEKSTKKIDDNTYECLIYYNKQMETELLIEVLSFGPMIKVLGNDEFLKQLKERLQRQKLLSHLATKNLTS